MVHVVQVCELAFTQDSSCVSWKKEPQGEHPGPAVLASPPETPAGASFPSLKLLQSVRFHAGWTPPPPTSTTCCIASVSLFFRASELGRPQGSSVSCLLRSQRRQRGHSTPMSQERGRAVSKFPRMQALIVCALAAMHSGIYCSDCPTVTKMCKLLKGKGRLKNTLSL